MAKVTPDMHVYRWSLLDGAYADIGPATGSIGEKVADVIGGFRLEVKPADWKGRAGMAVMRKPK